MLSTNEHAITLDQALILLFVNRVAHIHTYRVYMMVGRVVSLNCPIGTQQLKYLQQKLMLICKRSLHKQATNRQQNEQNLWGITLCGLQSVNQLTVYSWMSHFTLFGEGLWWALLPNFIQYTPGMQIMSLHTGKFLVARLSHMQTKIQRSKQRKAGWGPGNEATQERRMKILTTLSGSPSRTDSLKEINAWVKWNNERICTLWELLDWKTGILWENS